ncbi:MAG: hydrophobe/amphiphile efflux family transporter [Sphingomonas bacterium]|uniref:multidrug efflux RND transporter permease subunit n=1 Tax=Sphingomonas bacterium TaxID=1895847 RepID=UPI002634447F|nr:multidrug efflux RND transporter permease subunit [Sphingomonas bacterium]MDB5702923.1 hydrophobe/amphiphile efflux family transporter [Sphingomonas bacterium]
MSRIFIDRPIFAWVIAIIIMLIGFGCITMMPTAQYPDVAPTQVNISATYPGASAETVQNSVTQIIEQQLIGIDGMLYFTSTSSSQGQVTISATFSKGTNPDVAQMQVQNAVQGGISRLPNQVQQQGLTVTKSNPDLLLVVALYDERDRMTNFDVADWLTSNLQDQLGRIPGVGSTGVFGGAYAMRIWLDPDKLRSYSLMPSDVINAIAAQNTQVAAGEVGGQPQPATQRLDAIVTAQSMMQTPDQFRNIIVKSDASGARVLLSDVARVELGANNYNMVARANGHPGAGISISLAPGADALATANLVKQKVDQISRSFPAGLGYTYTNDTTAFIKLSVTEVVKTLFEAMVLVVIVMFVFLQSWRATLIPAIAIPVVLLGTFGLLYMLGFSINTMTLFGLVLAIGLLVDDAIVVVENVERLLAENPDLTPREATIQSMGQIQVALVAIAVVLSAVFLPMVFFGGSTGVIYRQFSATIVSAMLLSVFVAMTLSPALAATLLKRTAEPAEGGGGLSARFPVVGRSLARARAGFNRGFARVTEFYVGSVHNVIGRKGLSLAIYCVIVALLAVLFLRLPTGFLPTEDQGTVSVQFRLPAGSSEGQTLEVQQALENYFLHGPESRNVATYFTVAGGGQGASGQNTGQAFINLTDFAKRPGAQNRAAAIVQRATAAFRHFRNAQVFALVPGAIRGLGQSAGFTMELQNSSGMSLTEFEAARDRLLAMAQADPTLAQVRLSQLPDNASLKVDVDQERVAALGLNTADVNNTLSTAWGGNYVDDFLDRGRVKRVLVEGDAQYRAAPSDIDQWSVRNNLGQMVPFASFARTSWSLAPVTLSRFQGVSSYEFQGNAAPGTSSGQSMLRIAQLAAQIPGVSVAWAGQSYQEQLSSGQAPLLYGISLIVIFLCLAALYESWSVPLAVMLVIPLGLVGAVFAVTLRGLQNDVYLQIGLLTTMGLAAKNAILVVEFAERAEKEGKPVIEAALEAARIRIRPILMTSFAFIFGVLPLAISTGAGANSRIAIGTSVIGGMLTATLLAIFYIPLFFVLVRRGAHGGLNWIRTRIAPAAEPQA